MFMTVGCNIHAELLIDLSKIKREIIWNENDDKVTQKTVSSTQSM